MNARLLRRARLKAGDRLSLNGVTLEVHLNLPPEQQVDGHDRGASSPLVPTEGDLLNVMGLFTHVLAKLYAVMHQDQVTAMKRQTELLEELVAAVKTGQLPATPLKALDPPAVEAEETPALQIPRPLSPADEDALGEAHQWFLNRLAKLKGAGG